MPLTDIVFLLTWVQETDVAGCLVIHGTNTHLCSQIMCSFNNLCSVFFTHCWLTKLNYLWIGACNTEEYSTSTILSPPSFFHSVLLVLFRLFLMSITQGYLEFEGEVLVDHLLIVWWCYYMTKLLNMHEAHRLQCDCTRFCGSLSEVSSDRPPLWSYFGHHAVKCKVSL